VQQFVSELATFEKKARQQRKYFLGPKLSKLFEGLFANIFNLIRDSENSHPLQQENTREKNLHLECDN
jgi:hypothetical protein